LYFRGSTFLPREKIPEHWLYVWAGGIKCVCIPVADYFYLHTRCNHRVPFNWNTDVHITLRKVVREVGCQEVSSRSPYKEWYKYENLTKINKMDWSSWKSFVMFDHWDTAIGLPE